MDLLKQKLDLLPDQSGVYIMKNGDGQIIYIGKAKILKNRVRSYFKGSHDGKTQLMVSQIADFEYIITDSEIEALLLECNLIKKHHPKYNILLKDDKSYPYLMITNEEHPRLIVTRQMKKDRGKFFGPYPNASAAKEAARLLNRIFPFRKCRQLSTRACLYYHLGQCLAPCIHSVPPEAYERTRKEVSAFLRGGQDKIIKELKNKMTQASESLQFEKAKEYRDLIHDLQSLCEKQNITLPDFVSRDVIGYATANDTMCIQVFYFRQGKLVARDNFFFPYYEDCEDAFISFLVQFYAENNQVWPKEILLPPLTDSVLTDLFPVKTPVRGNKQKLVQMAMSNAQITLNEKITLEDHQIDKTALELHDLGSALGIPAPQLIESFDISNLAGTHTVAGMIQFTHGKPKRDGYRKFKILPMPFQDDTAAMRQVLERRYTRLINEHLPQPDLILIDGGKGQIRAALEVLDFLHLNIPVAGMVKNDRHQTAALLDQFGNEVQLKHQSPAFHLIERIQDEVHRFAITFHRQQRAKHMTLSILDGIPGIGPKRRQLLMANYKSLELIKTATIEDLMTSGLPKTAAIQVYTHFHPNK